MKRKLFLLSAFTFLFSTAIFSQVTKFKSTSFAYKTKNEKTEKWSNWSEFEKTTLLISIDLTNNRIKIFSKEEQVYDIIKFYEKETDSDGDDTFKFQCQDEEGLKCYLRFVVLNSRNGRRQLYIDFSDIMWMYNIYKLD